MSLEQSGVPGDITVWGDVLYDGPLPRETSDADFRNVRARFHAGAFLSYENALAMHERWDRGLALAASSDEVVLWFEHDLHDQLLLVRQLEWLSRCAPQTSVSLICIGTFPGIEPFHGLGQLDPSQLASLLGTRRPVDERQRALGRATWHAFTGSDPRAVERVLSSDTTPLPFLAGALRRLLEEFPDTRSGLSRTERSLLTLLAQHESIPFLELFFLHQQTEEATFMGDWTFWSRLETLASGERPLIQLHPADAAPQIERATISTTDDGRRVLAGELDWVDIASFDRWIGGAHLRAPAAVWRWNAAEHRLVEPAQQMRR